MKKYLMPLFYASDEEKPALSQKLFGEGVPAMYQVLSKKMVPGKKFFWGDKCSATDIGLGSFFLGMVRNPKNPMKAGWDATWAAAPENIKTWIANIEEEFKEYLASRPESEF